MKMLFGTTESQAVCKWNIFFGLIYDFLGPKLKITGLRSSQRGMFHQSEIPEFEILEFSNYYQVTEVKRKRFK